MKKYIAEIGSFLILAGGIAMKALDIDWFLHPTIQLIWYITAFLPVGLPVFREAWESICAKDYFNEYMLMSLAAIGAFYIGEYPEGVAVMLFYAIGERFQDSAIKRARSYNRQNQKTEISKRLVQKK